MPEDDSIKCYYFNEIAFYSTDPESRIFYAKKAVDLALENENYRQAALGMRYVGNGLRQKGILTEAIDYYIKSSNYYSIAGVKLGVGVVLLDLGQLYRVQGNFKSSKSYYSQSIEIFRTFQDSVRLASGLLNIGELYRINFINDTALYYFEEAKKIFQKINYGSRVAYAIGNIGLIEKEQGRIDSAKLHLKTAILALSEIEDYDPVSTYQLALSDIYFQKGEKTKALAYADSALAVGLNEGLKEQIRDASLQLSELYSSERNYEEGYKHLKQYLIYRDSINNEETIRKMADLRTEFEVGQKQAEVDLLEQEAYVHRVFIWAGVVVGVLFLGLIILLHRLYLMKVRTVRIVKERRRVIQGQRDQLDLLNATKDRFFSIISHDLRGPVSNFNGVAYLMQRSIEEANLEELKRLGTIMEESSHELSSLLDNLLGWAMSQKGQFPYSPEEVSLEEICNPAIRVVSNTAESKHIGMTKEIVSDLMLYVDANSASTIIRNLLSNAIKFTGEGGKVILKVEQEDDFAVIEVSDTGIGIPQERMDKLFGFEGDRKRWGTQGEKGVGLGLNLVKEFVDLNKGKVEVESEEGKGTTFRVFLPIFKSQAIVE